MATPIEKICINEVPTTECIRVSSLRRIYGQNANLKKWMEMPNHLYVGRQGRIMIISPHSGEKNMYYYKRSKWANPFKVGDYTLDECVSLYMEYVEKTPYLRNTLHELKGLKLGCFCNQEDLCHAKVLVELYKRYV